MTARNVTYQGYIIVNRDWMPYIQLQMGMGTFGRTAGEAWRRHIPMEGKDQLDFPIFVQRWSDRGYLPMRVEVRALPDGGVE